MVSAGWAHVYTFADNNLKGTELTALENRARAARKGIWALPRWQVIEAAKCCRDEDIGLYQMVRGKVLKIGRGEGRTYLNFGPDWRTDFTVLILKSDEKWFKKQGVKNLDAYVGKTVLVRGFTAPINGVMIRATHPQQLEVVE
jgi:hypothetical protein